MKTFFTFLLLLIWTSKNICFAQLSATDTVLQKASCGGTCNGQAEIIVTGGLPPYSYLWNDPSSQSTSIASNLCASKYSVTVIDSNNDTLIRDIIVTTLAGTYIDSIYIVPTSDTISCNGMISITTNGIPYGYAYSYDWSTGDTTNFITGLCSGQFTVTVLDNFACIFGWTGIIIFNNTQPCTPDTTYSQSAICNGDGIFLQGNYQTTAGTYYDTLQNINGCDSVIVVTLTVNPNPNLFITTTDVTCHDSCNGYLNPVANGGTSPYTYIWSTGSDWWFPLCAGTSSFTVTDANGCIATESATINEPPILTTSVSTTNATCNGVCNGNAVVIASGGTSPYSYFWGSPWGPPFPNTWCAGNYSATISDSNGCITSDSFLISQPDSISALTFSTPSNDNFCDGSVSVIANGGTSPYYYQWLNSLGQQVNDTGLCSGVYFVVITDANGCTKTAKAVVADSLTGMAENHSFSEIKIIPNPNDGKFLLRSDNLQFSKIKIYSLIGELIYDSDYRSNDFDLSKYPRGIYSIEIITQDNSLYGKLIIQ